MTEPHIADVTPAQRAVAVQLAADGASDQRIATRLGMKPPTVRRHMAAALLAAGCESRAELAVALIRGRVKLRVGPGPGRPRSQP